MSDMWRSPVGLEGVERRGCPEPIAKSTAPVTPRRRAVGRSRRRERGPTGVPAAEPDRYAGRDTE
ncbi:hypothetical protein KCMC57_up26160 [Kitasatospora sp. CMC57]|uniref:Uncharacterized protein n=1 Tax=Kitasatospora sp. CMC57 TaxID=3231513 RepID=A0AB33JXR8_9ACTN